MFGIVFDGAPEPGTCKFPAEFEGHPLRKDFPPGRDDTVPGLVDVEPMPGEDPPERRPTAEVGEGA